MGVFSRLADILNANVNAMLDRAEDPEKTIRMIIQEMQETLVEVRATAAKTIAEQKEITRRLDRVKEAQTEWERKAELALRKGREDLTRAALIEKAKLADTAQLLEQDLAALEHALRQSEADMTRLDAKLTEAKARHQTMIAREQTATNRLRTRHHLHDSRIDDAFSRFEQVERRIDRLEGEVEAYDVFRGRSLADEIAELEADATIEAELEALRARVKGASTDGTQAGSGLKSGS